MYIPNIIHNIIHAIKYTVATLKSFQVTTINLKKKINDFHVVSCLSKEIKFRLVGMCIP